jgi:uncharacterized small protein (DUF1192 family)
VSLVQELSALRAAIDANTVEVKKLSVAGLPESVAALNVNVTELNANIKKLIETLNDPIEGLDAELDKPTTHNP